MRVQHNIAAMNSYRNYSNNTKTINKNLEKLSSGYKINRAGDNAAGLAISEKMRAQITGLDVAQKNAKDGISLVQTAEGALTEVHSMLNRMVELAEQSANGTYDSSLDRDQLQKEVNQLRTEIDRIADSSNFNGIKLLDGSLGGGSASATGATFNGANITLPKAAELTTDDGGFAQKFKTKTIVDVTSATSGTTDFLRIDGKNVTIDWKNDAEASKLAATLNADHDNDSEDVLKSLGKQLESVINNSAKAQGVNASVSVSVASDGKITIKSDSKATTSEFSYLGNDGASQAEGKVGIMNFLINGTSASDDVASINQVKDALVYDGRSVAATDKFQMTLNGVTLDVTGVVATAGGASPSKLSAVATSLQSAIQAAVGNYNTRLGLTAGKTDSTSGLTGLTTTDFTAEVGDNGNLVIKYKGDLDVDFSFSDVGERSIASDLGLASGSSKSGGNQGLTLQIGDTSDSFNQLNVSISNMHVNSMGINGVDISTQTGAANAMDAIKSAINYVSDCRGTLGATQNRLEHTINNLSVMQENIQDAESTIRDTDVADEMMKYTKNSILVQSAQAMLAQANQQPQGVLQLLQ